MDLGPAIFVIYLEETNKKQIFCEGTFTSFFKDKKSKRSRKTVESRFFLLILLDDRRIRIYTSDLWIRIRIQEAQKHPDPDPQNRSKESFVKG